LLPIRRYGGESTLLIRGLEDEPTPPVCLGQIVLSRDSVAPAWRERDLPLDPCLIVKLAHVRTLTKKTRQPLGRAKILHGLV